MIRYCLSLPFWTLAFIFGGIGACFEAVAKLINPSKELP